MVEQFSEAAQETVTAQGRPRMEPHSMAGAAALIRIQEIAATNRIDFPIFMTSSREFQRLRYSRFPNPVKRRDIPAAFQGSQPIPRNPPPSNPCKGNLGV